MRLILSLPLLRFGVELESPMKGGIRLLKIKRNRAGNGNRTRMASLEGWNFTIKLCPQRERKSAATTRDCQAIFPRSTRVCYLISHGLASGMRNFLSFGAAIFFGFLISVRADLTIVQRVEGAGQDGEVTVKIKGDKERIDAAPHPGRIIDAKTGEMTDLINDQKTYEKISAAQIKAAALAANPDSRPR